MTLQQLALPMEMPPRAGWLPAWLTDDQADALLLLASRYAQAWAALETVTAHWPDHTHPDVVRDRAALDDLMGTDGAPGLIDRAKRAAAVLFPDGFPEDVRAWIDAASADPRAQRSGAALLGVPAVPAVPDHNDKEPADVAA